MATKAMTGNQSASSFPVMSLAAKAAHTARATSQLAPTPLAKTTQKEALVFCSAIFMRLSRQGLSAKLSVCQPSNQATNSAPAELPRYTHPHLRSTRPRLILHDNKGGTK